MNANVLEDEPLLRSVCESDSNSPSSTPAGADASPHVGSVLLRPVERGEADPSRMVVLSGVCERLRGLKRRDLMGTRDCVVLVPCRDVHTFGMDEAIDVAFVDANGSVVRVHRGVTAGRRLRCPLARMAVERFAREGRWLEVGDGIFAVPPSEGRD